MRYVYLAILITGSAALTGCFNDSDNNFNANNGVDNSLAIDQAKAQSAVDSVSAVINASNNVDTDEPQDISRIVLPEANIAEPVAVSGANASL